MFSVLRILLSWVVSLQRGSPFFFIFWVSFGGVVSYYAKLYKVYFYATRFTYLLVFMLDI